MTQPTGSDIPLGWALLFHLPARAVVLVNQVTGEWRPWR